jgi:hypothetical protein
MGTVEEGSLRKVFFPVHSPAHHWRHSSRATKALRTLLVSQRLGRTQVNPIPGDKSGMHKQSERRRRMLRHHLGEASGGAWCLRVNHGEYVRWE